MTYLIMFGVFFLLLVLGAPIALSLGLSSLLALVYNGTSLTLVASNIYSGIGKYLLLSVPFFVLSGNIMARAGISERLIAFIDALLGHLRGGIAMVCVVVACFFGAISGSGAATVAALGVFQCKLVPYRPFSFYKPIPDRSLFHLHHSPNIMVLDIFTDVNYQRNKYQRNRHTTD